MQPVKMAHSQCPYFGYSHGRVPHLGLAKTHILECAPEAAHLKATKALACAIEAGTRSVLHGRARNAVFDTLVASSVQRCGRSTGALR